MSARSSHLLIKPDFSKPEYQHVTPENAGWEHLNFCAVRLDLNDHWSFDTAENELALVILGGTCDVVSTAGEFLNIGSRVDVFHGMPTTLYLPRHVQFSVTPKNGGVDFACGWAKTDKDHQPVLIRPDEAVVEIRGGENATRQINKMIPPGFACNRLVVVEVYTPSGNWSSYPPHKHDRRVIDTNWNLIEADLEEVYFYKMDKPEGFAYQRIYNDDRSLDELMLVNDSDLVLSPEGYHPVVAGQGYNVYYLNVLAGSDQSLASTDDPKYSWVKDSWKEKDPRLPLVTIDMNK